MTSIRVFMLDAACSTMPYDHSLCQALVREGGEVEFFGSQYVHTDWTHPASYRRRDHFYTRTTALYRHKPRGFLRRYVKTAEHVFDMLRLVRLARKLRPDVIHFQWSQIPSIDRWFLPRLKRIAPLVHTVHNSTPLHGERPRFHRLQLQGYSAFLHRFDHLIAHTNYTRDTLVATAGIPADRISVIPHGLLDYYLRMDGATGSTSRYMIGEDEQVVLFFGGISHYKGLDVLVEAFGRLPRSTLVKTRLLIVGRPAIPIDPIRRTATALGVADRIIWDLRFVAEEEIDAVFSAATLVAMPYRHSDQSGVLMTAVSYGKPIVASRIGGFVELIEDGVHGRLVEPENPAALAAALADILEKRELAQKMEGAVRQLAIQWPSWDIIARETIRVYQDLKDHRVA